MHQNQWCHTELCFSINLATCDLWKALHTKRDKRRFYFFNLWKYKPKEKNVGGLGTLYPRRLKMWRDTTPVPPT